LSAITDLQRIGIKLFTEEFSVDQQDFIGVFHRWIQEQSVQDHLLVDVADYSHVRNGPGILLVSHEANINSDETDGRPGLQYLRKQPLSGSFGERLGSVLHTAIVAAQRLEENPSCRDACDSVAMSFSLSPTIACWLQTRTRLSRH